MPGWDFRDPGSESKARLTRWSQRGARRRAFDENNDGMAQWTQALGERRSNALGGDTREVGNVQPAY